MLFCWGLLLILLIADENRSEPVPKSDDVTGNIPVHRTRRGLNLSNWSWLLPDWLRSDDGKSVVDFRTAWDNFKEEYSQYKGNLKQGLKNYFSKRFEIFCENLKKIKEHNKLYESGAIPFDIHVNQFADMAPEEIQVQNGARPPTVLEIHENDTNSNVSLSDDLIAFGVRNETNFRNANVTGSAQNGIVFNWYDAGMVSPVQDQGECGSCWAFSAAAAIEAQLYKKTGRMTVLSPQQLLDCTDPTKTTGCTGGWMFNAFNYVVDNGITSSAIYPYNETQGTCTYNPKFLRTKIARGAYVSPLGNETALLNALTTIGPISVAIDASKFGFIYYRTGMFIGVYKDPGCTKNVNHAVVITGYGTDPKTGLDFWLIKNSWGTSWGENGYGKIARNADNQCGIASYGQYPLL